jgi:two-component system invasion response regulator UvrY
MFSKKIRILIVDDSDVVRGAIRALLQEEKERSEAYESGDAEGAIEKAHEIKPEVILLDMSLPGVSGVELAKRFRDSFPGAKIILMSAQDPMVLHKLTELAGLQMCIAKTELSTELLPMLGKIASDAVS